MPVYNPNGSRKPQCPYCFEGEALFDDHSKTIHCSACDYIMWVPGLSSVGNMNADPRNSIVAINEVGEYKIVKRN